MDMYETSSESQTFFLAMCEQYSLASTKKLEIHSLKMESTTSDEGFIWWSLTESSGYRLSGLQIPMLIEARSATSVLLIEITLPDKLL